jgi:hypothetical protein
MQTMQHVLKMPKYPSYLNIQNKLLRVLLYATGPVFSRLAIEGYPKSDFLPVSLTRVSHHPKSKLVNV